MKTASKLSLLFLAIAIIITIAAVSMLYLTSQEKLEKSIYDNLASTLSSRCDRIEKYFKMIETSVGELSKNVALESWLKTIYKESPARKDAFDAATKKLIRTKEANPAIAELLLMDSAGKVVASSSEKSIGSDKSTGSIFLGARDRPDVKDIYYSDMYGEPLMAVSAPIFDDVTGELSGVIAARIRLNDLNDIVTDGTGLGDTGEIYIVNKYGYMITRSRFKEDAILKQTVDTRNVKHFRLNKERGKALLCGNEMGIFSNYRGVSVMGTYEYIPRLQWLVLADVEEKEAMASLAKIRLILIAILFIAPIVGWLLVRMIFKIIAGLIGKLRKKIVRTDRGNIGHGPVADTHDEIGQLSMAFDTMSQNLKMITVSIGMLNREMTEHKKADEERRIEDDRLKMRLLSEKSKENIALLDELIKKHDDEIRELKMKNIELEKRVG